MPAIEVRGVHKAFRIPHEKYTTLTERVMSLFRPISYEHFEALRGVDLEIEPGSFVGIVGGNGSGKSTLLKIVSGLLPPDSGTVRVNGTMSALLELGLGFSAELTVRENVELYAAVLGYPRSEVRRRVEEAIEFADLDRFRDAKLKNLSTGMRARLGFATALQAEADIMLLDEILAVGDADFQLKCLGVFEELKRRRKTILLVSHDMGQLQRFCDEAVLLERGAIVTRGDPVAVIRRYLKPVGGARAAIAETAEEAARYGSGRLRVVEGWLEDREGRRIGRARSGDRPAIVIRIRVLEEAPSPAFGVAIVSEDGTVVYSTNTSWLGARTDPVRPGDVVEVRMDFAALLPNGKYEIRAAVADQRLTTYHDVRNEVAHFVIHGSRCRHGVADLQGQMTHRVLVAGDGDPPDDVRVYGSEGLVS
jgi:lipopolysaccharide transport system ATP-binding protein